MHLISAQSCSVSDIAEPTDLQQSPAPVIILSSVDTEVAALQSAKTRLGTTVPPIRLANISSLTHHYSVDLYIQSTLQHARVIFLRLLGGRDYWPYGLDEVLRVTRGNNIALAVMPGCSNPDPELLSLSTVPASTLTHLWSRFNTGGPANWDGILQASHILVSNPHALIEHEHDPDPWPGAGLMSGACRPISTDNQVARDNQPVALIIFYRVLAISDDLAVPLALAQALEAQGLTPVMSYITSLKHVASRQALEKVFQSVSPSILIMLTAFSEGSGTSEDPLLSRPGVPLLQAVMSGESRQAWKENPRGLLARDLAIQVALPEMDGRSGFVAISTKSAGIWNTDTQTSIRMHEPDHERLEWLASLASSWVNLRQSDPSNVQIAIIASCYPGPAGGRAHGVGLDTPGSLVVILDQLREAGFRTGNPPRDPDQLIDAIERPDHPLVMNLDTYISRFSMLPAPVQRRVAEQWGPPELDTLYDAGSGQFRFSMIRSGNVVLALQPSRFGPENGSTAEYHDLARDPPHGYIAFYFAVAGYFENSGSDDFRANAIVHLGKHGTLEWMPGKACALGPDCIPGCLHGPVPSIYPFIVNDPGEGAQAKRRLGSVIVDHLTPAMRDSSTHGALYELERLVDEYFDACSYHPKRVKILARDIASRIRLNGISRDCGIRNEDDLSTSLSKLDAYLCDLKSLQIRDGLHIFGKSPTDEARTRMLASLNRHETEFSVAWSLAKDLGIHADLKQAPHRHNVWKAPRPDLLDRVPIERPWRLVSDTWERLDFLVNRWIANPNDCPETLPLTIGALRELKLRLAPRLDQSGSHELAAIVQALRGRFVTPGPSGSPTRARTDVLPTGRNFYSLDTRALPTRAACQLGKLSADQLISDYRSREGNWLRRAAITVWGSAAMRTGGEDLGKIMALLGVRPQWHETSARVNSFEILPLRDLGRPRVDVLLRLSGFFRDSFPDQIALIDSMVQAVAALDEPDEDNPLACARRLGQPLCRMYSSAPGQFGTGVKEAILRRSEDRNRQFLAERYLHTSSHAVTAKSIEPDSKGLQDFLARTDATILTQDSREFDLLDSDDFYDYEGGLALAVEMLKGSPPIAYHIDSSDPDHPNVRTLQQEIALIVSGRATHPDWISGMMRHRSRGAFEITRTVNSLFGFALTTHAVQDHQFDGLFTAYVLDQNVRRFIQKTNPEAFASMLRMFRDSIDLNLWHPHINDVSRWLTDPPDTGEKQ